MLKSHRFIISSKPSGHIIAILIDDFRDIAFTDCVRYTLI